MKNEPQFLPENYEFLKVGQPIQRGDYFWSEEQRKWCKVRFTSNTTCWVKEHVIRKNEKVNKKD